MKIKSDEPKLPLLAGDDDEEDTLQERPAPLLAGVAHHLERDPSRVLIAEDDDPLRDMLETILRLEGHHVRTVPSADEMLRMVTSNQDRFDVILTDVRMPGKSGLDIVATLRSGGHKIPIIVMTAFPDDGIRSRAHALNTLLIAKPFSLESICLAIESLVRDAAVGKTGGEGAWKH